MDEQNMAGAVPEAAETVRPVPITKRANRRKQDISAVAIEENVVSVLHPLTAGGTISAEESGMLATKANHWMADDQAYDGEDGGIGGANELEDDDLQFKGYSYTYSSPHDNKSLLDFFACEKCPAIYDSRVGLTNHSKLHGSDHPLQCGICDFACTNRKTLRFHRRAHGVLPSRGRPPVIKSEPMETKDPSFLSEVHRLDSMPQKREKIGEIGRAGRKGVLIITEHDGSSIIRTKEQDEWRGDRVAEKRILKDYVGPAKRTRMSERLSKEIDHSDSDQLKTRHVNVEEAGIGEEQFIIIQRNAVAETPASPTTNIASNPPPPLSRGNINLAGFEEEEEDDEDGEGYDEEGKDPSSSTHEYSRNQGVVKCPLCPYTTQSRVRLGPHLRGHSRSTGFMCSVCEFKHESQSWLRRHCMLHQQEEGKRFLWPPNYVNVKKEVEG